MKGEDGDDTRLGVGMGVLGVSGGLMFTLHGRLWKSSVCPINNDYKINHKIECSPRHKFVM